MMMMMMMMVIKCNAPKPDFYFILIYIPKAASAFIVKSPSAFVWCVENKCCMLIKINVPPTFYMESFTNSIKPILNKYLSLHQVGCFN